MVEIGVRYEGEFRCAATHGPSGDALRTDAPKDNLGLGEAFSPTDLVATALATCMLTTMAIVAQKRGLEIDLAGTEATVKKFMTDAPPRRIAKVEVRVAIPLPGDHPSREVVEQAARNCPVALSLHPETAQEVSFHWQP